MPPVDVGRRNTWTWLVSEAAKSFGISSSLTRWNNKPGPPTRYGAEGSGCKTNNLAKLVGAMIALGMTSGEIQHRFDIDPEHSRGFWVAFIKLPEAEQVDAFRWADRLNKQARFRMGDM